MPGAIGYYFPKYWVERRVQSRQGEIQDGFPDALDMLLVCVEAGQSLDQGIIRVSKELNAGYPALAEELEIVSQEVKAGKEKTKRTSRAPREAASKPSAPVPANASRQHQPVKSCPSQLNKVSRTRSGVGRRPTLEATSSRVRLHCPPMMRTWPGARAAAAPGDLWVTSDALRGFLGSVCMRCILVE